MGQRSSEIYFPQLDTLERQELKAFEDSDAGLLRHELYERKMLQLKEQRFMLEKQLNELEPQNGLATLEPTRNRFLAGNTARFRFLEAELEDQKIVAAEVLWNLLIRDGETEEVRYRSFYQVLAKAPKSGDLENLLRALDEVRTVLLAGKSEFAYKILPDLLVAV